MTSIRSIRKKLRRPGRNLKNLTDIMKLSARLYTPGSPAWFRGVSRGVKMYVDKGHAPEEAFRLGLFFPAEDNDDWHAGKQRMTELQTRINPKPWSLLTEDKGLFYRFCIASGIPVPELCALFFKNIAGWSFTKPVLKTSEEWVDFLENELPSSFMIKPMRGYYGKKVSVWKRNDNGFSDHNGRLKNAQQIFDFMKNDDEFDRFLIQERLRAHPDIVALTGTDNLQTARIMTLYDCKGEFHIVYGCFRVIGGNVPTDNFHGGRTGNLVAKLDEDAGKIQQVVSVRDDGRGNQVIERHPRTGGIFEGYQLPLWDEALQTIRSAAPHFLPIRAIGWDVGLTDRGVVIIEANMWCDPPNRFGRGGKVYRRILEEI